MRNALAALGALMTLAVGCSDRGANRLAWPGVVDAEVDDLTGVRTGLFRTYGPTQTLIAGTHTIPVTIGYWCEVDEDTEPVTATDGLFFRIAMPDTSLVSDDRAAFEELSGQLGLLDIARMAVDGQVYAWKYEPAPTLGGWFLDGAMGFEPYSVLDTEAKRKGLLEMLERLAFAGVEVITEQWPPAHDYVTSHYVGRDTVGIELKRVLKFSMESFAAAIDSVRFWCPVPQSNHEWNSTRVVYVRTLDSLRTTALLQDGASAKFVVGRVGGRENFARHFVKYAREKGVYPLRSLDDLREVCGYWEQLSFAQKHEVGKLPMDILCRDLSRH